MSLSSFRQEYCVMKWFVTTLPFFVTSSVEVCLLCFSFCKSEITVWFHSYSGTMRKLLQAKKLLQLSLIISTPSSSAVCLMVEGKVTSEEGSWWVIGINTALKSAHLNSPATLLSLLSVYFVNKTLLSFLKWADLRMDVQMTK